MTRARWASRPVSGRALTALAGLLALGVIVRLLAAASVPLFFDEARVGVMARGVLAGEFPFFFYGQAFMGAAEAYVHAPGLALLGSSALGLRSLAVLVSLVHVAAVWLLARRLAGAGAGRWAALAALVPSAYLLKWSIDPRLHYGLVLVLTPLCLLLALAATDAATRAARTRAFLVLAFVAGLAWWINLLVTAVLAVCAAWLAARRPRLDPAALLAPGLALLGLAPAWLFALVHARLPALAVPLTWSAAPDHARELVRRGIPHVLGVPHRAVEGPAGVALALLATAVLALLLGAGLARGVRRPGLLLPVATTVLAILPTLVTERGLTLATEDPRYLLPVLALLPVLVGTALAWLAGRRPAAAAVVMAVVVLAQGAGLLAAYGQLRSPAAWQARRADAVRPARLAADLAARELRFLYTHDPDVLTFAGGGSILLSHFYLDDDPVTARRVDAAPQVAYLAAQVPPGFEESLRAAGIRFVRETIGARRLYTEFALEHAAYREIAPVGWRASADPRPDLAAHVLDRDAGTRWRTAGRPAGARLELDLGRVHPVGMVAWLPGGYREVPLGFRLETSVDGRQWALAREVREYYGPLYWAAGHPMGRVRWGRVEVRFPARPARHLRLTHLGQDDRLPWTIRELFVYEPIEAAPGPTLDAAATARALQARGVARVHADHGHGARLLEAAGGRLQALADNVRVDRYGLTPSLDRLPYVELAPDTALVYPAEAESAAAIEAALRRAGVGFAASEAGGYRILDRLGPAPGPGRVVRGVGATATVAGGAAAPAILDGRAETHWTTGRPQRPGDHLIVALDRPTEIAGVEIEVAVTPFDYPRGVAIEVARGDGGWEALPATPAWIGPLVWTGTHVLRAGVERVRVVFPPVRARALRIVQTGDDPVFAWSVAELRLLAP